MTGYNEAPEGLDSVGVRAGRRGASYTDVHDWVTFSKVSPTAKALYVVLRAHVNRQRADDMVWTSTLALAHILGYSRGDKTTEFVKELTGLGAIEADRGGLHGRLVFVVNQEPAEDYEGPRTVAEWHERNRAELDRQRTEEKAKRDGRRTRAKARRSEDSSSSDAVHPDRGEQPVAPDRGEPVTPDQGEPVHPYRGREPDVLEPDVSEPGSEAASRLRRAGGEIELASNGQITIDGNVEAPPAPRQITNTDLANEIARVWIGYWSSPKKNTPIGGSAPHVLQAMMTSLVLGFLNHGYSRDEIGKALNQIGEPVIPEKPRMQRALAAVRGHRAPAQQGSRAGARVNGYWDGVRAVEGETTEMATAAAGADVQTTGAAW